MSLRRRKNVGREGQARMRHWILGRPVGQFAPACEEDDRVPVRAGARRRGGVMSMRAGVVSLVAGVTAVLAVTLALAGVASATLTREPEPFSPLTGSASSATLSRYLEGIAIDDATGNVFITNTYKVPGSEGVVILGDEGGTPAGLLSPFVIPGTAFFPTNRPSFLAYDNSASSPRKGTLYAYDPTAKAIKGYARNAATEQYEEVAADEVSLPGCGTSSGGGIDASGDIYFTCEDVSVLYELGSTGTVLHEYNLEGTPLRGTRVNGVVTEVVTEAGEIAVDAAGDLFAKAGKGLYELPVNVAGEIDPADYKEVKVEEVKGELLTTVVTSVAYEPNSAEIVVATGGGRVVEYNAATLAKVDEFGAEALRYEYNGRTNVALLQQIVIAPATHRVYLAINEPNKNIGAVAVFGPQVTVPTARAYAASNITGTKATLNGGVNPEGIEVTGCFFEYGETTAYGHMVECEQPIATSGEPQPVSANIGSLTPDGAVYHYRLVARNANGGEKSADRTLVTAGTVVTGPASGVTSDSAALNGYVRPEGSQYGECLFEYKLPTETSFTAVSCSPEAGEIEPDFSEHPVSAQLEGLQANATYQFRLKAVTAKGPDYGEVATFTTVGPPQITELRASFATQSSATLEAEIDPSGFSTYYRFEWGPTSGYGNVVPADFEPYIGSGTTPVHVTAKISGLTAASVYHYRLVAYNTLSGRSTTESDDQTLETLDTCGLPEDRCFEMVSPKELGPVAAPGEYSTESKPFSQASTTGDSFAYSVEYGLPGSNLGGETDYIATRGARSWESSQYSPNMIAPNEQYSVAFTSDLLGLSPTLKCGVIASTQPLTDDPAARLIDEVGGNNLYRRNPDGSYTLITRMVPQPLVAISLLSAYRLVGMSPDCGRIFFQSNYHYPGAPGAGNSRLYEWDEGTLRTVGWIPGVSGEEAVEAEAGAGDSPSEQRGGGQTPVSRDGSVVAFNAVRLAGNDPGEVGKRGVFVRIDGERTVDVSLSQTSTPDSEAYYQGMTPDGSRIYFTANAGLTLRSSSEGIDLYEYDLEDETLTDLSVSDQPGGAEVAGGINTDSGAFPASWEGLVGGAEDGSRVYFFALGQLVPGRGRTLAENKANKARTLYEYEAATGSVRFVGTVDSNGGEIDWGYVDVSPDGRYVLFESSENQTAYDSGGSPEDYLYDADAISEPVVCVSCRLDGKPTSYHGGLHEGTTTLGPSQIRHALVESSGRPLAFFRSRDALAPGAVQGEYNLYEWAHGEIYTIATVPPGSTPEHEGGVLEFAGASTNGSDVYFFDPVALNWENPEGTHAVWDARVGGGFAQPPETPSCDPIAEGVCLGAVSPPPVLLPPASTSFSGVGNLVSPVGEKVGTGHGKHRSAHKHRRKARRKHDGKKVHGVHRRHTQKDTHRVHGAGARNANRDREAGK